MKKIRIFAALLCAILYGCEGYVDPSDGSNAGNDTPSDIVGDGGNEDSADGGNEDSGKDEDNDTSDLVGEIALQTDNEVIKADGAYVAKLSVILTDKHGTRYDVTSDVEIYCEGNDKPLEGSDFTTTEEGVYEFYAIRGFDISNKVSVRAANGIPDLPADTDPENTSFSHRLMLLQHTGNECPNCPKMMNILKRIAEDETYNSLYNHVASHSYNATDAAYSSAAATLSKNMNVTLYPMLTYNLSQESDYDEYEIKQRILELHNDVAEVGLSAAVAHVGGVESKGGSVYATVSLKSAVTAKYRVAVWLLEDNIPSPQSGADAPWQNVHDNCLRFMYGNSKTECIYGKPVGEIKAGDTHEILVAIDLVDKWIASNGKLFIAAVEAGGNYDLLNCIVCPVGSSVSYDYL